MGTAVGGAAGMPLSVAVSTTGLGLGDYMGSITLSAPNAKPTSVTVPVVLHITDSGMPPADAGSDTGMGSADAGTDSSMSTGSGGAATGGAAGQGGATSGGAGSGTAGAGGATGGSGTTQAGSGGSISSTGAGGSGTDSGCGCRVAETERSSPWAAIAAAMASLAIVRRRAKRRAGELAS
jgi:MYXO-CTERM domain-containing protein